jgi:hypothetical protein
MADDDDPWIIDNIFENDDDVIPGPGNAPAAGPVGEGGRKRKRKHKSSKRKGKGSKRRKISKKRRGSRKRY